MANYSFNDIISAYSQKKEWEKSIKIFDIWKNLDQLFEKYYVKQINSK